MSIIKKQLVANRENAQKSTGPKTVEGKAVSAQNAVKHGFYTRDIIINSLYLKEDASEYVLLFQSLCDELKPETVFQEYLVRKIVNCLWRSQRAIIAETAHINHQLDSVDSAYHYATCLDSRFRKNDDYDNENDIEEDTETKNESVTNDKEPELSTHIKADIIGMRTLPDDSDSQKILRYEMRLDRQMTRIFRLLKQLQKGRNIEPPESNNREP